MANGNNTNLKRQPASPEREDSVTIDALPIDEHKNQIMKHIDTHRVTIIQGETGCGKSSRLPIMLIEHGEAMGRPVRMMVAQPRRIAAHALMERAKQCGHGNIVGMRMGHGVREEGRDTRVWYVTTGYLARLCAHKPEQFKDHSHIVIDEVHERTIDSDLLCLFSRRLLDACPNLRLILMSATIHTTLYTSYFAQYSPGPAVFVGARRFPVPFACIHT